MTEQTEKKIFSPRFSCTFYYQKQPTQIQAGDFLILRKHDRCADIAFLRGLTPMYLCVGSPDNYPLEDKLYIDRGYSIIFLGTLLAATTKLDLVRITQNEENEIYTFVEPGTDPPP